MPTTSAPSAAARAGQRAQLQPGTRVVEQDAPFEVAGPPCSGPIAPAARRRRARSRRASALARATCASRSASATWRCASKALQASSAASPGSMPAGCGAGLASIACTCSARAGGCTWCAHRARRARKSVHPQQPAQQQEASAAPAAPPSARSAPGSVVTTMASSSRLQTARPVTPAITAQRNWREPAAAGRRRGAMLSRRAAGARRCGRACAHGATARNRQTACTRWWSPRWRSRCRMATAAPSRPESPAPPRRRPPG